MEPSSPNPIQSLAVPIAIVFGFGLIAVAVYFSGAAAPSTPTQSNATNNEVVNPGSRTVVPINAEDHVRGNPNAEIVLIEYSDYDCPFCKTYHETMNLIMNEYGINGEVAWVYRHFPLQELHPNAPRIAAASECVAELAGNEAFWEFSDLIFSEREQKEPANVTRLAEFAARVGVQSGAYEDCLASGRTQAKVEEDMRSGFNAGARSTPYTVIMVGDQQETIEGAQSYTRMKTIIDGILSQIERQSGSVPTTPDTTTEAAQ